MPCSATKNIKTKRALQDYHEIELTKFGKCHVLRNIPAQKNKHGLILWINANHQHYYDSELKIDDRVVDGVYAGVRVFLEDVESEYIDARYGANKK